MSHVINWNAVTGAVKYRVYRSTTKFDNTTLPIDTKDTADGTVLTMSYDDAVRNTVYWYMISSFDNNGVEVCGQIFNAGYFPDTGPGPQTLIRGDWMFGFFGEVPISQLMAGQEIVNMLKAGGYPSLTQVGTIALTTFAKVAVNGKILFLPNSPITQYSIGSGSQNSITLNLPNGIPLALASSPVLSKNGYDYMYRYPKTSLNDANYLNGVLPTYTAEDYLRSEASMYASLFNTSAVTKAAANQGNVASAITWGHVLDWVMGTPWGNGVITSTGPGYQMNQTTGAIGGIYSTIIYNPFVLELLF